MHVRNFLWVDGAPADDKALRTVEDVRRALPELSGQFAIHARGADRRHLLVRDPLGVNKLFFVVRDEQVHSSNFLIELVRRGHDLDEINSVPAGHLIAIDVAERTLHLHKYHEIAFSHRGGAEASLEVHAQAIRRRMGEVFRQLGEAIAGRTLFVALSGGLDSTAIAVAAREYLGDFTAITFAVADGSGDLPESEDLYFARIVAKHLGVAIEPVIVSPADVAAKLDVALLYGQDWRDFNVHCALVNACIAAQIAEASQSAPTASARPVILTGDTMNELMADYAPVNFRGQTYYSLPRLPPDRLRKFLVSGLDAGDREVGVYAAFGIDVVQPYALMAPTYAALPSALIEATEAKQRVVREVMGDRIPAAIYARPKVRAQVGGADDVGGTLGVMVDAGLTGERLARRFCELFQCDEETRNRLIKAGFYRFPHRFPSSEALL